MTPADRLELLNSLILAVRPHGMLSETVLEPLQTLRDDLAAESASQPVEPSRTKHSHAPKASAPAPSEPDAK